MKVFTAALLCLSFVVPIWATTLESPQNPPPSAKVELTPEEIEWWKAVELAGSEAAQKGKVVGNQIAAHRQRNFESTRAEALEHVTAEALRDYQEARDNYFRLLEEGIKKNFRSPVENAKPRLLFAPSPLYTKEGRDKKVCGTATVRVEVAPNGVPLSATVLKSVQKRCPESADVYEGGRIKTEPISANPPPLGNGLDEDAVEVGMGMIFLPAIRDHRPVAASPKVEVHYNLFP